VSERSRERRIALLSWVGWIVLLILSRTWRWRHVNRETLLAHRAKGQAVIQAFWHGQLLAMMIEARKQNVMVMVSEHGDGEIISRALSRLGFGLVRGSSSRGAARALLAGAREVENGHDLIVTPDGPRGPAKSVAPGAAAIAQRTGAPIMPIGIYASRAWRLKSWDSLMIPKPFAIVRVAYGPPLLVNTDTARKSVEAANGVHAAIEAAIAAAERGSL
jgi:lysophospholipid acyltransferase (LPLAT)-like uncharacterized protein